MCLQNGNKYFSKFSSSFLVVKLGINQRREEVAGLARCQTLFGEII